MSAKRNDIGDPLDNVIATGRIGSNRKNPSSPDTQAPSMPDVQHASSPEPLNGSSHGNIQTSSSPAVQHAKRPKRVQQTVYLPPDLTKWLRIRAIEEEREISDIASDALDTYKRLHQ